MLVVGDEGLLMSDGAEMSRTRVAFISVEEVGVCVSAMGDVRDIARRACALIVLVAARELFIALNAVFARRGWRSYDPRLQGWSTMTRIVTCAPIDTVRVVENAESM